MPNFFDHLSPRAAALLMDAVFEAQGADFALVDADFRYLHVSQTLARKSSLSARQHVGTLVSDIMEPEKWQQTRPHLETALQGTSVHNQPHTGREPSPTPHARASFLPVRLPHAPPVVAVVVEEKSSLHQVETELRDARQEAAAFRARVEQDELLRYEFMRDVLSSVTEGRFHLCRDPADLPPKREPFQHPEPLRLTPSCGVRELRKWAEAAAFALGMAETDWFDMETAVGEAAMNTIVHAPGGIGSVYIGAANTLQVWVSDGGGGIPIHYLPRAVLQKGFTTTGTMGCGWSLMLQTCDRLWLQTDAHGTTVVLEKDAHPSAPVWLEGNSFA